MHLIRGEPLFQCAMPISGDPRLRPVQLVEKNEQVYTSLANEMGVANAPAAERIRTLRSVPWEKLIASPLNMRCFPFEQGGFKSLAGNFEALEQ